MLDNNKKIDGRKTRTEFYKKYEEFKDTWDFKLEFLKDAEKLIETNAFNEHRYNAMKNLLRKVARWERRYNKDVYEFDMSQLKGMLKEFNSNSELSLMSQKSNLEYYLWYAKEVRHKGNANIPHTINLTMDEISEFINPVGKEARFITRDELYDLVIYKKEEIIDERTDKKEIIESGLKNYVDQALILLIFEGIMGKANQELVDLEWRNIDFKKCIIKSGDKQIKIETVLADILEKANNQEDYELANGKVTGEAKRSKVKIVDKHNSPYFIRPIQSKNKLDEQQISGGSIQRRILNSCKMYLDRPYLTLSSIYISGLADRGVKHSYKEFGGELMRNADWQVFIKQTGEKVNLQDSYKLYKEFWEKDKEEQEELEEQMKQEKQQED